MLAADVRLRPLARASMEPASDPVVRELDVYLAHGLARQLYLLQYPLWPRSRTFGDGRSAVLGARIKPQQRKVRCDRGSGPASAADPTAGACLHRASRQQQPATTDDNNTGINDVARAGGRNRHAC